MSVYFPKESKFYFFCAQKILFTSSLLGIELCAPFLVTATEENKDLAVLSVYFPKESKFYFFCAQKILFTSSLLGIELCAPFLVTATEENTLANLIAFSTLIFSDNPVTKENSVYLFSFRNRTLRPFSCNRHRGKYIGKSDCFFNTHIF